MLIFDGRIGEGGGQILRTCLSLSALLGRPFRMKHIRAGRRKPGLKPQHLACVRAAAAICGAEIVGDELHSQTLEFHPQHSPQNGRFTFDVTQEAKQGSAGSTSLILQAVLWPLLFSGGGSQISIRGGTHVNFSPSFHYLQNVTFPNYRKFGIQVHLMLHEWGWYPKGGGQINAEIMPLAAPSLQAVDLQPLPTTAVRGLSIATNLPGHIPHRMARRADNLLEAAGYSLKINTKRQKSHSEGAGLFLWAENGRVGGTGYGRPGYPAQSVAEDAVQELLATPPDQGLVDPHLADQLLIPMALADGPSHMVVSKWTPHAQTNAAILEEWLNVRIDHQDGKVEVDPFGDTK